MTRRTSTLGARWMVSRQSPSSMTTLSTCPPSDATVERTGGSVNRASKSTAPPLASSSTVTSSQWGRASTRDERVPVASLLGLVTGVGAQALATGPNDRIGLYLVGGAVLVQLPLYSVIGIDTDDFGPKEYLYIAFITFSMWFITWGILLTTGATV